MNPRTVAAEVSEQVVWSRLWQAMDFQTRAKLGISSQKFLDADCLLMKSIKEWFFNRVIGLGLVQSVSETDIDRLVRYYHDNAVPIGISLCPEIKNKSIVRWLQDRGFSIANHWSKMVRDASQPATVNCDLRIELATENLGEVAGNIVVDGFGLGDMLRPVFTAMVKVETNRVYLAWDGDVPVAVGTLTIFNNIGHLNTAATLPGYRGRGAQGAIIARRIQDGIDLGCEIFVSETWQPGEEINHSYNNMIRHGFKLAYERPNWVLPLENA